MEQEIQDLKDLPLSDLMSNPLNSVLAAQTSAAMTTANFIQQVGFENQTNAKHSIFDILTGGSTQTEQLKMRTAELSFVKKQVKADGTVEEVDEKVELPFISLFNIPSFEINRLNWSFNARLKRMEALESDLTSSTTTNTQGTTNASLDLKKLGLHVGTSIRVEATNKTDFDLRYGLGREHEYNLQISVEASSGPAPRGIERLLAIAEKIAAANEAAAAATTVAAA